jgi:hypothetical protein
LVITFSTQTSAPFVKILVENFDMSIFWHVPILVGQIWLSTNQARSSCVVIHPVRRASPVQPSRRPAGRDASVSCVTSGGRHTIPAARRSPPSLPPRHPSEALARVVLLRGYVARPAACAAPRSRRPAPAPAPLGLGSWPGSLDDNDGSNCQC